jgi:PAS domain S-box-containing protein
MARIRWILLIDRHPARHLHWFLVSCQWDLLLPGGILKLFPRAPMDFGFMVCGRWRVRADSMKMPASVGSTLEDQLAAARAHSQLLEAHFDATIEQLPIGIARADLDDRIVRCNGTFCAMMGRSKQELLGRFFSEITYPEDVDGSIAALRRLWAGSVEHYAIDKRYLRKDGTPIWAHVTVAPSRDAHGRMDGAVGIMEDITERKAAEAEVERIQGARGHLAPSGDGGDRSECAP